MIFIIIKIPGFPRNGVQRTSDQNRDRQPRVCHPQLFSQSRSLHLEDQRHPSIPTAATPLSQHPFQRIQDQQLHPEVGSRHRQAEKI